MSRRTLIGYAARYFGLERRRPFGEGNIAGRSLRFFDKCDIEQIMRIATLSEMLEEVIHLGEATGTEENAHEVRGELEGRLATVHAALSGAGSPRVIALERLDPPRVGGFWIPEMISIAGGVDVAGDPGLNPAEVGWGELSSLAAEVVIVMPGGSVEDAQAQAMEHWERVASIGAKRAFAVDGEAFSEPGPRLIDGVELLGHLLHPELIGPPGSTAFTALEAPVTRPSSRNI
jgi:iron complex transport system substrate-binding protein